MHTIRLAFMATEENMEKSAINGKYKGKSFLKLLDFTSEDIQYFLDLSAQLKAEKKSGIPHQIHSGKNIALLFEKTSTRDLITNHVRWWCSFRRL